MAHYGLQVMKRKLPRPVVICYISDNRQIHLKCTFSNDQIKDDQEQGNKAST